MTTAGDNEEGISLYPSGNVAANTAATPTGRFYTFHADTPACQVLAYFDHQGVGGVNHRNGKPWLIVNSDGWTVSDPSGSIKSRGKFPRHSTEPIVCDVTDHLTVKFFNRQSIDVHLSTDVINKVFQCGEHVRRASSYLENVIGKGANGTLMLNVGAIRERIQQVGSLYIPKGPHHFVTPPPGVGILKTLVKKLPPDSHVLPIIADLQSSSSRVAGLSTSLSCTASPPAASTGGSMLDYGHPELSATQRRLKRTLISERDKTNYQHQPRRLKLKTMSMNEVESQALGKSAPSDVLIVLCVLADWSPACTQLAARVEEVHKSFTSKAAADSQSPEAFVQIYKVDASESNALQKRFNFRSVPMLLACFQGRLVAATNAPRTAEELQQFMLDALFKGRVKSFLPQDYAFQMTDNSLLDKITPDMSLMHGKLSGRS